MPLTVRALSAEPSLHLELVAGAAGADRLIEAAHVCELPEPGPWLQGGELLMTVGLLLPLDSPRCAGYLRHLVDSGVCGLALGLGRDLPYQAAPQALVDAAEAQGLPLLTVADDVPFLAVTKAVFAARAAEERRELERSMQVHRSLTAAAAANRGLDPVLGAWWPACAVGAVVLDPVGRVLAAVGCDADAVEAGAGLLAARAAAQGLRGLVQGEIGSVRVELHPLGTERLRGVVVLVGEVSPWVRRALVTLVAMLSLELERRHLADEPQRRARAQRLRRLLADTSTDAEARDLLAGSGISSPTVRALAVAATGEQGVDVASDLALALRGGLVQARRDVVVAVADDEADLATLATRFAPGLAAGIGSAVRPGQAARSVDEAVAALAVSARLGRPAGAEEAGSLQLLLGLGDAGVLTGFADAVLACVDAVDSSGQLARTVQAWLSANCSWEDTAAALGVHRHTVRNRVSRVEQLTGRNLGLAAERHELWLALQARAALTGRN